MADVAASVLARLKNQGGGKAEEVISFACSSFAKRNSCAV